ncbi:MAG: trypsin-like peptidase domain-containing protein [Burkholderiales bacterium]|nr:trypsin-like peptidase domain-containing protein [Burkholderiales bacterium]
MRNWHGWAVLLLCVAALSSARAGLVEVIESVKPSVLAVGSYNPLKAPRFTFHGTGFVVGNGNLVVTNAHVLPAGSAADPDARLMVLLPRPNEAHELRAATVVRNEPAHDLALLRIDGSALPALALSDGTLLRDGHAVALIGYPVAGVLGYRPVTHRGIVASVTAVALPAPNSRQLDPRAVTQLRQGPFVLYQLDATAYPGNSGGPLLDAQTGTVVGVVNMGLLKATKESALALPSGITYAIPGRYVLELMKER